MLFLWGSSIHNLWVNNLAQEGLTIKFFKLSFLIQAQCLLKQKLLHDLVKIFNRNHGTISHFKCLEMVTSCNNSSVTGNAMIQTKLSFMNDVSVQASYKKKLWSLFDNVCMYVCMHVNLCQHHPRWNRSRAVQRIPTTQMKLFPENSKRL